MGYMHELKEKLCDELNEIARKPEMSAGDLEAVHKLTDTIKNIDKIEMLEEDGDYSRAGDWEAYGRGSSYANRDKHYVRGHYSREGDMDNYSSRNRDSRGRYSRDGAKDRMMEHLDEMMREAGSEKEREAIRHCMSQLENV